MVHSDVTGSIRELIASDAPVHMSGIGGVGMAGLALLLQARGVPVSGCDMHPGPFAEGLRAAGIPVSAKHVLPFAQHSPAWVIRSAAVRMEQPDLQEALSLGIPVFRRGEILPVLVKDAKRSVAVAGTHGKTTTSTLIAQLLHRLDPAWCIGGVSAQYPMPGGTGAGPLVVEADESDGTLARYISDVALVTNVDFDHMEHFDSISDFEACFAAFLGQARDHVVYCADDVRATSLSRCCGRTALGYGFSDGALVRGAWTGKREMMVTFPDGQETRITLPPTLPGQHNALNLLGSLAVCHVMGVPEHTWTPEIPALCLPARRFEVVADGCGIQIVTDYAHHPVEIKAVIEMARELHKGRLLAVFQPHRYSRTLALMQDFPAAFDGVDQLVLTPVYAASEKPLAGASAADLLAQFRATGFGCHAVLASGLEEAANMICEQMSAGDLILVIGAGDIEKVGRMLAEVIPSLNDSD